MFETAEGQAVAAVTESQMREVDRVAEEEFGLSVLQMMENAGRNLARHVLLMAESDDIEVTVLAGAGGNGGGGLCCARHLHNRGLNVAIVLDRDPNDLKGPAGVQLHILREAGVQPLAYADAAAAIARADVVVDSMIGYGLQSEPRGRAAELIMHCNRQATRVLSLDIPSGMIATTGETPGVAIRPERTLTLAAPKTGLCRLTGQLFLADIGIPPAVFHRIGVNFASPFTSGYWVRLTVV